MDNKMKGFQLLTLIETLPARERDELLELWTMSSGSGRSAMDIPDDEVEKALESVHQKLGITDAGSKTEAVDKPGRIFSYARYMAAAIALVVFVSAYFLLPKTVTAPYGELVELTLPDGSIVELNSGTTIQHNRLFSIQNRDLTLNGEAYFSVRSGNHPFTISSNGAVTEVTGTEFNVRSWSDEQPIGTRVSVIKGSVLFYPEHATDKGITLGADESGLWNQGMVEPGKPAELSRESVLGWRDNLFVFTEKPLKSIFRDIERRFDTKISLEADIGHELLTGYYGEVQSVEHLLNDICTVKGLRYAKTANGYRVFK
ncbi:MAG: FecR family protein [Balneolaceae bacterium]